MFDLRKLFRRKSVDDEIDDLRARIDAFSDLLRSNNRVLELIGDAEEKLGGDYLFDGRYLETLDAELAAAVESVVNDLRRIQPGKHDALQEVYRRVREAVSANLAAGPVPREGPPCLDLSVIGTEHAGVVGEKLARLGELRNRLGLAVPDGFAITACAFASVYRSEQLVALSRAAMAPDTDVSSAAKALQQAVMALELPSQLSKAIKRSLSRFDKRASFAVRSSALGEDGNLSFAGLHESVLNVPRGSVASAYVRVVASLFSERPVRYRRDHDEPLSSAAMAVGCMLMVPAVASGVLYSLDPNHPESDTMLVDAAWGLGATVVEGSGALDRFTLSRTTPTRVVAREISHKATQCALVGDGTQVVEVPGAKRDEPCVSDAVLAELADIALAVERHMRSPQDIEWAVDAAGTVWVLQARTLRMAPTAAVRSAELQHSLASHDVLLRGRGVVACRGIGSGKVVVVMPGTKAGAVPAGCVLVARFPSPGLSALIPTASALLTDGGSATGHLATIAREHRVPAIMNTVIATQALPPGMDVTVDAEENIVYAGQVQELIRYDLLQSDAYSDTREFRVLRAMLANIAPLNLRDRASDDFRAEACRTYHDVIRFAHEKALEALSELSESGVGSRGRHARALALEIPLDLVLVDVGGGIAPDAQEKRVALSQLACEPLRLLLEGLTAPGVWATSPAEMDLAGFMASATRSVTLTAPVERNLAVVSSQYMNLSLRLGYHFNVIDGYLGEGQEDSYLHFRFVGGVTEMARRKRRAALLCEILTHYDFAVERTGDLVIGRLNGAPRALVQERLGVIGRLVGFSRQLDIMLRDEETASRMLGVFLAGGCSPDAVGGEQEGKMAEATRVLVLDDEATVGERLKDFLEKKGMVVEAFVDSKAAIARLDAERFDVVVTDLKMQGPTGLDVLLHVREKELPTEVIIITAYANFEDARGAEVVGAFDFITKPFRLTDILELVKKAAKKAGQRG